jgi:Tol biopolymer transport system component
VVHVRPTRHGLAHGVVYLATPGDPVPRALAHCPDGSCDSVRASDLAWSPDGGRLAVAGRGRIWVVPTDRAGRFDAVAGCASCGARAPTWSPDGRTLAYVTNTGVFENDLRSSTVRRLSDQVPASIAWSPDGSRLMLAGIGLYVLDLAHPGPLLAATAHEDQSGGVTDAAWSPDGTQLVWFATPGGGTNNGSRAEIGVAHLATRSSRAVVDHRCCVQSWTAPRWAPDGTRITWVEQASRDAHGWLYVVAPDGGAERRYPASDGAGPPAWRPTR